jgi:hypothetical protein
MVKRIRMKCSGLPSLTRNKNTVVYTNTIEQNLETTSRGIVRVCEIRSGTVSSYDIRQ